MAYNLLDSRDRLSGLYPQVEMMPSSLGGLYQQPFQSLQDAPSWQSRFEDAPQWGQWGGGGLGDLQESSNWMNRLRQMFSGDEF